MLPVRCPDSCDHPSPSLSRPQGSPGVRLNAVPFRRPGRSVSGVLALALAIFPLVFMGYGTAQAQTSPSSPPVFSLLSAPPSPRQLSQLGRQAGQPVALQPLDPGLIQALQWSAPSASLEACPEQARRIRLELEAQHYASPPATDTGLLPALLTQAEQQILFVDLPGALNTLSLARGWLACVQERLPAQVVGNLFLLEGVTWLYLEDVRAQPSLEDALALAPDLPLSNDYPANVQQAWLEARRSLERRSPVVVEVAAGAFPGQLVVNDRPIPTDVQVTLPLRPGRHLFQLRSPQGLVRTQLIPLRAGSASSVSLTSLTDFGLPTPELVTQQLARSLRNLQLDDGQRQGVRSWLETQEAESLLVALEDSSLQPVLVRVDRTGTVTPLRPLTTGSTRQPDVGPARPPRAPLSWVLSAGLGGQGLVGTAYAFPVNGRALGYALRLEARGRGLDPWLSLSWLPHLLRAEGGGCGTFAGGTVTEEAVLEAASCVPGQALGRLGLGLARGFGLGGGLSWRPEAGLEGAWLPGTVVVGEGVEGVEVVDAVLAGLVVRVGVEYAPSKGAWLVGARAGTGLWLAPTRGQLTLAVPGQLEVAAGWRF